MSWRETLGVIPANDKCYAHNSQYAQKPIEHTSPTPSPTWQAIPGSNCADIADSAHKNSEQESSGLLEALTDACERLDITPAEVKEALAPEDIEEWRNGTISVDTMRAFARSLVERRKTNQGTCPDHYTKQATCKRCGPIWLWFSGKVLGCPWCWNRLRDKPIPRPSSVRCGDCIHFERSNHPHTGRCAKNEPGAIVGLWDTDRRYCERFLPKPQEIHSD